MPPRAKTAKSGEESGKANGNGARLGFEAELWLVAEDIEDDGEPFAEKFAQLKAKLEEQFAEGRGLEEEIRRNLESIEIAELEA